MLLLDLSLTSHTRARTGIQHVARSITAALKQAAVPICHDPYAGVWRELQPWERANLEFFRGSAAKRSAHWPLVARTRGRLSRSLGRSAPPLPAHDGLVVPEVFSSTVAQALPVLFAATTGPRVAIFHDALPLKYPELSAPSTVARFPAYLKELIAFDGIAAVSEDSRQCLLGYWDWLGVAARPPVIVLTHGINRPEIARATAPIIPPGEPVILSVGSIEGRKNHAALLDACERLWSTGEKFTLQMIGLAHPQTGRKSLERIRALQAQRRSLRYDGPVDDAALEQAYAHCTFTVYPSLAEGFGLPVIESLVHGKPCVCSARGALGEISRHGGCLALDEMNAESIAAAIRVLLSDGEKRAALSLQASRRTFKTWRDYTNELSAWIRSLPRR